MGKGRPSKAGTEKALGKKSRVRRGPTLAQTFGVPGAPSVRDGIEGNPIGSGQTKAKAEVDGPEK